MLGYKFWIESTQSGKLNHDQILQLNVSIENTEGVLVEFYSKTIRLRPGLKPSPEQLMFYKINPLSKSWEQNSITEWVMVHDLKKLSEKYSNNGIKPIFIAFNGTETFQKFKNIFELCSIDISDYFNNTVMDVSKTVENLISQKLINLNNSTFSLQSVAKCLGTDIGIKKDIELLPKTSHAIFELATCLSYSKLISYPETFKENETYEIFSNSYSSGLSKRNIIIINNDNSKIIAYDFLKKQIICLNYATIIHSKLINNKDNYLNYITEEDIKIASNNFFKKEKNQNEIKLIKEFETKISNSFSVKEIIPELESELKNRGYSTSDMEKIISKAINRSAIQGKTQLTNGRNNIIINQEFQNIIKNPKHSLKFISKLINDWEIYYHQKIQLHTAQDTNEQSSEVFYNLSTVTETFQTPIIPKNELAWNTKLTLQIYNSETQETHEKTFYFYEYLNKIQFKSAKLLTCEFNNKELPIDILSTKEFLAITNENPIKLEWNKDNNTGNSINLLLYRESIIPLNNMEETSIVPNLNKDIQKDISNFLFSETTLTANSLDQSISEISNFLNNSNNFISEQIKLIKNPEYLLSLNWDNSIKFEPNRYYLIKTVTNKISHIIFAKIISVNENLVLFTNLVLKDENKHNLSTSLLNLLSEESLELNKISQIIKLKE